MRMIPLLFLSGTRASSRWTKLSIQTENKGKPLAWLCLKVTKSTYTIISIAHLLTRCILFLSLVQKLKWKNVNFLFYRGDCETILDSLDSQILAEKIDLQMQIKYIKSKLVFLSQNVQPVTFYRSSPPACHFSPHQFFAHSHLPDCLCCFVFQASETWIPYPGSVTTWICTCLPASFPWDISAALWILYFLSLRLSAHVCTFTSSINPWNVAVYPWWSAFGSNPLCLAHILLHFFYICISCNKMSVFSSHTVKMIFLTF